MGAVSNTRTVNVRMKVTGAFDDNYVHRDQIVKFAGSVAPNHRYQKVYPQTRIDGTWYTFDQYTRLSDKSTYYFRGDMGEPGTFYFRSYIPADADHAAGYSPIRKITAC